MKERLKHIMRGLGKRFRTADRLTALIAGVVLVASLVTVAPGFAAGEVDSNLGGTDVSISRFSEVMAESFNNVLSNAFMVDGQAEKWMKKVDAGEHTWAMYVDVGRIGNLLGYPGGTDSTENSSNVWTKGTDAASRVLTLQTVAGFYGSSTPSGAGASTLNITGDSKMSQYIVWGSTLNYLGVDEFRDAQSASDGIRMIIGYAMYVCFILAYTAGSIMSNVVGLMKKFNVFQMFWNGGTGFLRTLASDSKFLDTIDAALEEMYSLRWVIMGILVVVFAASVTFWKSRGYNQAANAQQKMRNFLYRLVVMCIGVPLCGMFYTECLDIIGTMTSSTSVVLTDYVFQEFLDFEKWTTGSVDRMTGKSTSFKVDSDTGFNTINVVYSTNMQQFDITGGSTDTGAIDASKFVFAANQSMYGKDVIGSVDNANFVQKLFARGSDSAQAGSYSDLQTGGNTSVKTSKEAYNIARNLILNYARSNTVSPDTLNDVYVLDYKEMVSYMSDTGDVNSTAIEQMFGTEAAEQRIWSYISDMGTDWVYEHDGNSLELPLAGSTDKQVMVKLTGITAFPSVYSSGSGVSINGKGPIMRRSLINSGSNDSIKVTGSPKIELDGAENYKYTFTYDLSKGGMSAMSLYNYMHTKFENGQITVYSPDNTTNAGVGLMHYAVTTPYSGIPEIVQLLYILSVLFSLGVIGWAFGMSLLINTIVQAFKAIPIIFKMLMGSVQGFVEGMLIVFSIAAELLVTIFLYTQAVNIIDLLIKLVNGTARVILNTFGVAAAGSGDNESYAILSGAISIFIIIWGTFELMKWRQAITISIKSIVTHILNQVFGTSAAMPTGASNGMLKGAAALAAGGMAMGALAEDGALSDVVNDLTGTDLGDSLHDKISEGDWEGAMEDVKDYAGGTYRGRSDTADAEGILGEGDDIGSANGWQSLTDDDMQELSDEHGAGIQEAKDELAAAQESGDEDAIAAAEAKLQERRDARDADAAARRQANYQKANELGVADYGDYLREQKEEAESHGLKPVEGADIPDDPSKTLDRDAQMAYDAAKDGDAQTLRNAAGIYDGNGLTAAQREKINEMIKNGADETEIATAIDNMRQENFGDDADAVVDKINEAAGRNGSETYGSTDNSDGDARTVSVKAGKGESGGLEYAVTDNNSERGEQTIEVSEADGLSTYENTTKGSDAKGDAITTVDMGTQAADDAGAMGYADIRENTGIVNDASGGMLLKESGKGKFGATTESEAAASAAAHQASSITGSRVTSSYGSSQAYTDAAFANAMGAAGVTDLSQAPIQAGGPNVTNGSNQLISTVTGQGSATVSGAVNTTVPTVSGAAPATSGIRYTESPTGGIVPASADNMQYECVVAPNGNMNFVPAGSDSRGTGSYVKQVVNGKEEYVPADSGTVSYSRMANGSGPATYVPHSDDGKIYVQQQGSGGIEYVEATGNVGAGTKQFVLQTDVNGQSQYVMTQPGTTYTKDSSTGSYVARGTKAASSPTQVLTQEDTIVDYTSGQGKTVTVPKQGGGYKPMTLSDLGINIGDGNLSAEEMILLNKAMGIFQEDDGTGSGGGNGR